MNIGIKMEKLFDLLKLHCRKKYMFGDNDEIEIDCDSVCFHLYFKWKRLFPLRYETIICKEFWFIKRLADNDHIDRPKVRLKIKDLWENYWRFGIYSWISIECLIMLLSIQDDPIKFICEILQ